MFGSGRPSGSERAQRRQQSLAIVIDAADAGEPEQLRENALHHLARGEHVGNAAGDAQVVLKHHIAAVGQAHQIGAGHGDVDAAGNVEFAHLPPEMLARINNFARHNSGGQAAALVVDIAQEEIQRVMRCSRPRSMVAHSWLVTIRGSRSCGKIRSVPSSRP
jgi:hypothetical protein